MIIQGKNAVREALKSETTIDKIYLLKGNADHMLGVIAAAAREKNIRVAFVERAVLDRESTDGHHQGVVAFATEYKYFELEDIYAEAAAKGKPHFILVLDGVEDPHNFGAIIRSAECAGADGIIIGSHRAVTVTDTVIKVSAGASAHVKIAKVGNINDALRDMKDKFIKVVAADASGKPVYGIDMKSDLAIVIGGEGEGVKKLTRDLSDEVASIPLKGEINSLNASVAAGIMLFECVRQRG